MRMSLHLLFLATILPALPFPVSASGGGIPPMVTSPVACSGLIEQLDTNEHYHTVPAASRSTKSLARCGTLCDRSVQRRTFRSPHDFG